MSTYTPGDVAGSDRFDGPNDEIAPEGTRTAPQVIVDDEFTVEDGEGSDRAGGRGLRKPLMVAVAIAAALALASGGSYAFGVSSQQDSIAAAQSDADDARAQIDDARARADQAQANADADAERQIEAAKEAYVAEYADRVADVAAREAAVQAREEKVGAVEAQVAANTFRPGTYLVPEELAPGRYRSDGTTGMCYAEQTKGDDIIWNTIEDTGTRAIFTVQNIPGSEVKFDSACGTIQKIG